MGGILMPSEPLPAKEVLDKLYTNWYATNVAEPEFTEVTGVGEPFRLDLNKKDHVVGKVGSPAMEEQPIGNYKYGNRTYNVELEIYTLQNRQRLYDIFREIRRLIHEQMHSLTNFQRMKFMNFNEQTQDQVNICVGTISIQLEKRAVLLETTPTNP